MTDQETLELTEEFFISVNRDCDLYTGAQVGDNGQSMVPGGHRLQLNAVNGEKLRDAKPHPEKYPNLIVRMWSRMRYTKTIF